MQRNHEAFSGDFRGSPCNSQRNFVHGFCEPEGFPDFKVEMSASSVGAVQSDSSLIRGNLVPHNEGYSGSFHPQKFCTWSNFRPQKVQQNQCDTLMNNFHSGTSEYSSPMEQNIQHSPFRMYAPDYQHAFQFQEFQYFVVIDFEATCDKGRVPHPQEIIEFPSVLVNSITGKLEASFQTYVRPIYHQLLTDFCKELTGIQQIQVDRGVSLSEALLMHDKWLENKGIKHTNFAVVTWSNWDCRVMLESECKFKKIRKPPYFNRWINLKVPFHEVFGGVRCNLKGAVELAGLEWEGRAHCGLDDARNTARLLALLMRRGFRFSITNSLVLPSVDHPLTWQMYADRPSMWCQYLDLPVSPTLHPHNFKHLVGPDPHFHLLSRSPGNDTHAYCFCGVMTCKRMVRKPGPKHGRFFFGCGNWTLTRGAICDYFQWAS